MPQGDGPRRSAHRVDGELLGAVWLAQVEPNPRRSRSLAALERISGRPPIVRLGEVALGLTGPVQDSIGGGGVQVQPSIEESFFTTVER